MTKGLVPLYKRLLQTEVKLEPTAFPSKIALHLPPRCFRPNRFDEEEVGETKFFSGNCCAR